LVGKIGKGLFARVYEQIKKAASVKSALLKAKTFIFSQQLLFCPNLDVSNTSSPSVPPLKHHVFLL
jgi:hypothetical protein